MGGATFWCTQNASPLYAVDDLSMFRLFHGTELTFFSVTFSYDCFWVFVARAVSIHCVTCFDSWLLWLGSSAEVTDSEIKYL